MPAPSLIPDTELRDVAKTLGEMDEEDAKRALAEIHTPALDALRSQIPSMKTSWLLGLSANPEGLAANLAAQSSPKPESQYELALIVAAAVSAIADEIDRRIPIL